MQLFFKYIRANTSEEFIANFFVFSKIGVFILFLMTNPNFALYFAGLCAVEMLFLKQPKYTGPSKLIRFSKDEQFYDSIIGYKDKELVVGLKAHEYY